MQIQLPSLSYRKADHSDIDALVGFINAAYRGDSSRLGWTTEADLLDGQRTDRQELTELIETPDSFILLGLLEGEWVACVHLQKSGDAAYLGMLTIKPGMQGQGIGKQVMQAAEQAAQREWGSRAMQMTVITLRSELIAFYERRGYRRTGKITPFPSDPRFGIPKVQGLQFELLEKPL